MKPIEWFIVFVFVILGLICLTFSATWILPGTHQHLSSTFFTICLYAFIPLSLAAVFYFLFRSRKKKR